MEEQVANLALEVKFDRATVTYKPLEWVSGSVRVFNPQGDRLQRFTNYGLKIRAEGILTAQNKATNKILESISAILNSVFLFKYETTLTTDEITTENNTFPFKFKLTPEPQEEFLETYVGVYVSISYEINVELNLSNSPKVKAAVPFFVQVPNQGVSMVKDNFIMPRPCSIEMYPEKLLPNIQNKTIPRFKITGQLESDICNFSEDIKGFFLIEECEGKIRTIDLQLIRVEKIENRLGKFSEATEIQLIQVGDGNLTRKIEIPLFMIFPVYFSCPNFSYKEFSVEFELNFIMILYDGFKITMNFPLNILRL